MPSLTTDDGPNTPGTADGPSVPMARIVAFAGSILVIIALALIPLLTPLFIHPALDAAGSADWLGMTSASAHEMSDRSVHELVFGPGTFAFAGPDGLPFFDAAERRHLADARLLLWLALAAGAASALLVGLGLAGASARSRASLWRMVSRAGASAAIVVTVLAILSLLAFSTLFTIFHQLFFPGGNWSFDPTTQRLVQLYPFAFWQIATAAFGVLVFMLGLAAWVIGRSLAGHAAPPGPTGSPAPTGSTSAAEAR